MFESYDAEAMPTPPSLEPMDPWRRLATYRDRYEIDDRLEPVLRLEQSIRRREYRLGAAKRRVAELEKMLAECRHEAQVLTREITESRRLGALLVDEIIEKVRVEMGEAWSPRPIRGFRAWSVRLDGFYGATDSRWETPTMEATCLRNVPLEDIPHRQTGCGPPACGVYATKSLEFLGGGGKVDRHVAMGVVAMTGKVIEHEHGYRGARATAVAMVVRLGGQWLLSDAPKVIGAMFEDLPRAMVEHGSKDAPTEIEIADFLNRAKKEEEAWI